ncbi:MAG: SDR family oxidoreductase [bacterium]|nr:SDR family oxidoreductase [bacterium]
MKVSGSVVMITGAAKRVGATVAKTLAEAGAKLILHYHRSQKDAEKLKGQLEKDFSTSVVIVQGNLKKLSDLKRLSQEAWDAFNRIDVLVNNASTFYPTPLGKVKEEEWEDLFAVNAKAPFFLGESLGLKMQKKGKGKVINIIDWAALRPYTSYVPYCASKAALISINRGLAKSLAPEVQVNAILPGPVLFPVDMSEAEKKRVLAQTPLKREGSPQDIASAVKFLIEGNDFMTGTELHVDGGRHL